jgi:hypothetical protein
MKTLMSSLFRRHLSQIKTVLAVAGTVTAMELSEAPARAAGALWVSAWNWSYSAAIAQSPVGTAYYWGLSVGPNSYSFAYAFSNDGLGDAGYAYAQAAARRGGRGAWIATGFADPWGGDALDTPLIDPSNPALYPTTDPGSDSFAPSSYTISNSGISFPSESGSDLNGDFQLEAFVYNGNTDMASLESELGASGSTGTSATGDVDTFSGLETDFGLTPLDNATDDPNGLASLAFTENTSMIDAGMDNVILVGMEDQPVPEPGTWALLATGLVAGLVFKKRNRA